MKSVYALTLLFFCATSHAEKITKTVKVDNSSSHFSIRIRPFAITQGVFGLEAFYHTANGWFIGPTAHFFSGENTVKVTTLTNSEIGIKLGKLFYSNDHQRGPFILGSVVTHNTTIGSLYSTTNQTFTTNIIQFSESLFVGYQFRATLLAETHWDLRIGAGIVYKPEVISYFRAIDGASIPLGVRKRLDSSLEFTLGYEI